MLSIGALGACLLADPPADLPVTPFAPPEILRTEVQPPITSFLDALPNQFTVPVAADPSQKELLWEFSEDGAGETNSAPIVDGGVLLAIAPPTPTNLQECHTLVLVVSYADLPTVPADSVAWFYSPTRSFDGCPVFDGGPQDAGSESSDNGSSDDGSGSGD
jgi:hypothetical protein